MRHPVTFYFHGDAIATPRPNSNGMMMITLDSPELEDEDNIVGLFSCPQACEDWAESYSYDDDAFQTQVLDQIDYILAWMIPDEKILEYVKTL